MTAYEMRISDWSSDVCSSDLTVGTFTWGHVPAFVLAIFRRDSHGRCRAMARGTIHGDDFSMDLHIAFAQALPPRDWLLAARGGTLVGFVATDAWSRWTSKRSEEHTSELQSLMRISYAVFCLKKKNIKNNKRPTYKNTYKMSKT